MKVALSELRPLAEAATPADGPKGRISVGIINPGWGSSGYYSSDVLEAAARDRVFPAGTHMYINHPTATESFERPERDLNTLAAVLTEDARWDGNTLVAEAQVFSTWREPIAEMADVIGVSIRGAAEVEEGEAEGRRGRIITRLVEGSSVDFVTKAGRGGKILQVLESARADATEATSNDVRDRLVDLVRDAHSSQEEDARVWAWVRDFDDTTVWFELEGETNGTFAQTYTTGEDGAPSALTGDRTEVRVRTEYVPVAPTSVPSRPAGQSTAYESLKEDTMAQTQIEESRLAQLEKDAGRAPVLESERDAAVQRAEEAEKALKAAHEAADTAIAESIIKGADVEFDALQTKGLLADRPLTESGRLDADAFKAAVEAAAAQVAEAQGAGSVRGMGSTTTGDVTESIDVDAAVARAFGRPVKEA